ncbi:nuclear transport factor 2 family protein [Gordonia sp. zg691]|uniref:Nuclear transport factor 2 family protein n=1 Tax=Gordonia jinghuaiqii TaxID=2758710 RepID=A0A7D7QRV6_9ACTN|nr:nuclear transport factor 2 family protein [Gordonia jinghuaiqii]MBD0862126.1 nuclear transport factor 2 family protein [Gordonia jinghuaiqii]MCR5978649.1 nuclear transport factor 2 family protein [Gordonia jinghuaiqii]QMT02966.1 nuclear transport factor 2 family protein [Gordonia jinghuaiqii]
MLSIEEISARLEIQQTLTAYATAVDSRRFDDLDPLFTADARLDFSVMGGVVGSLAESKAWLAEMLPAFTAYCHFLGNHEFEIDESRARTRTMCLNPMQTESSTFLIGLWYRDEWELVDNRWLISSRTLERCFDAQVA